MPCQCPVTGEWCATCTVNPPTLRSALDQLLAAKQRSNCRPTYIKSLEHYLGLFIKGREDWGIERVTLEVLDQWFDARGESPGVRQSNIGRISALTQFAVRRGWLMFNPCRRLEHVHREQAPPVVLTPGTVRKILDWAQVHRPELLGWMVCGFFLGLRPEEVRRIGWADIDLELRQVRISAAASKVHRRRIVTINDTALRWLLTLDMNQPLTPPLMTLRRARRELCAALGIEWHQDCARHTAATMLLAKEQRPGWVALQLGHSEKMLMQHYADLIEAKGVTEFWSIYPSVTEPDTREIAA